jgi:hypothetical protein
MSTNQSATAVLPEPRRSRVKTIDELDAAKPTITACLNSENFSGVTPNAHEFVRRFEAKINDEVVNKVSQLQEIRAGVATIRAILSEVRGTTNLVNVQAIKEQIRFVCMLIEMGCPEPGRPLLAFRPNFHQKMLEALTVTNKNLHTALLEGSNLLEFNATSAASTKTGRNAPENPEVKLQKQVEKMEKEMKQLKEARTKEMTAEEAKRLAKEAAKEIVESRQLPDLSSKKKREAFWQKGMPVAPTPAPTKQPGGQKQPTTTTKRTAPAPADVELIEEDE